MCIPTRIPPTRFSRCITAIEATDSSASNHHFASPSEKLSSGALIAADEARHGNRNIENAGGRFEGREGAGDRMNRNDVAKAECGKSCQTEIEKRAAGHFGLHRGPRFQKSVGVSRVDQAVYPSPEQSDDEIKADGAIEVSGRDSPRAPQIEEQAHSHKSEKSHQYGEVEKVDRPGWIEVME